MAVTSLSCEPPTQLADHARQCVAVLGPELTAYVAGVDSVARLDGCLGAPDEPARRLAVSRLSAAVEVIEIFAADNLAWLVRPWLREVGPGREPPPARSIRAAGDDGHTVKQVLQAATYWVSEQRVTRLADRGGLD